LCSKYGVTSLDTEELASAKDLLLLDIKGLKLADSVKLPPVPKRQGDNRHRNITDDICKLLTFLDENQLFQQLPTYVTHNVDRVPSIRLLDGDLKFMVLRMEAFEKGLSDVCEKVSALAAMTAKLEAHFSQLQCQ
jgi:hypothetical protein